LLNQLDAFFFCGNIEHFEKLFYALFDVCWLHVKVEFAVFHLEEIKEVVD
jgi:hypothetical protein